jgi:uncharacterized protein YqeY
MSFEDTLREKIKQSQVGSSDREILKLVLGECQQIMDKMTDERGHGIVKKLIKSNEDCLEHLAPEDPRYVQFVSENRLLSDLLPKYWTEDQIRERLVTDNIDVKSANNDGQAMGVAMKHLKEIGASVEGGSVKTAVAQIRAS